MAGSVEAIATDAVLLVELVGDGVHKSLGRHGLVESGIEHTHLRQTRHQLLHSVYTFQIGGVVQGSEVGALFESLQHLVGEEHALVELLTAVHHTMTHSVDLIKTLDDTNLRVCEQREDELHTLSMLRDIVHNLLLLTIGQFHFHKSTVQTYALSTTTGHHGLIVHVV